MARQMRRHEARQDSKEEEQFHLPRCMDCGRVIPERIQNFTVKYKTNLPTRVVCPNCSSRGIVRLKTPYVSFDGLHMISLLGGREE